MLQSPAAAATLSVQEGTSESRHRASASLGKTHFKLAPGILPAQSGSGSSNARRRSVATQTSSYYDEQWKQWMSSSTSQQASTSVQRQLNSTYDSAWTRWMAKYSPTSVESSSPVVTPFETVPRDAMLPIMSRLPLQDGEQDDIAAEPTRAGNLDYLKGDDEAGGMHEDENSRGQYTRARLPELDAESYALWQSLHSLRSISNDYSEGYIMPAKKVKGITAPHPIAQGMDQSECPAFAEDASISSQRALALIKKLFNWDKLPSLPAEMEGSWYGVAFRSKRRPGSESTNFYEDDRRSHEEAVNSGGLLMYWYGRPSEQTGHNLATCIWTNRSDAIKASSLTLHARAAVHARKAYESFELSRYAIRKVQGETQLRLEEWVE